MDLKTYRNLFLKVFILISAACTSQFATACTIKADFSLVLTNHYDVKVKNLSSGSATACEWDFGNGMTHIGFEPPDGTVRYMMPGLYTISLTVWDKTDQSCNDKIYKTVEIIDPPCRIFAGFSIVDDTNGNYAGIVSNYSVIQRPLKASFKWYFGDGDSSSQANPVHTYPGAGSYYLCLVIRDSVCKSEWCDSIRFDNNGNMKRLAPFSIKFTGGPVTGISGVHHEDPVFISPNPGKGQFAVNNSRELVMGRVYSITGKLVHEWQFDGSSAYTVDPGELGCGIYIVSLMGPGVTRYLRYVRE
jgi:hypothetical protein